ncbi:MAG: hypothetical protein Q8903_02045 [Bacteroidota bacterium]|nr:hypothetical protein [Bacteroidota bacterium]
MYKILLTIFVVVIGFSFANAQVFTPKDSLSISSDSLSGDEEFDNDSVFEFDNYKATITDGLLSVSDLQDNVVYSRAFNDPVIYTEDIDADSSDEFIIVDYQQKGTEFLYSMYVYKISEDVKLADSLFSGLVEPYLVDDEELGGIMIVAGQPEYDYLNNTDTEDLYSPIRCYVFENEELFDVDDELYDIFIDTNDELTATLDEFYKKNDSDCKSTEKIKAAIAEIYINYLSAQEKSLAQKFIDSYYFCNDKEKFVEKLNKLNEEE